MLVLPRGRATARNTSGPTCASTKRYCPALASCYEHCSLEQQAPPCYKNRCCPSRTSGEYNETGFGYYVCFGPTLCLWNCTVAYTKGPHPPPPPPPPSVPSLAARAFRPVPLGATLPRGWMRSQLDAQNAGLCGRGWLSGGGFRGPPTHANQSSWVRDGGTHGPIEESWPYWANGAVPLAALLQDAPAIAKLRAMMDHVLAAAAAADNWLGPAVNSGHWSSARAGTALAQWAEATGDERVIPALAAWAVRLLQYLGARPPQYKRVLEYLSRYGIR